ncbi:MAG: restriction endonuclease subunit S [Candidatus Saccharimonas sp.]
MSGSILTFGTQWLGQLPEDWSQMRARYLFRERKQKSSPDDTHLTPSQKYAVLPQSEYMKLTGNRVVLNITGSDNMKHVESGDFVIHLRSFQGGIEYSQYTGKVSNAYTVLQPKETVVPDFFRHVLKSYGFISELSKTTDQLRDGQSIKFSQLDLLEFPLPSPETQQKIADFLDAETAQIDNLIAKQERLLELLEEKRRATITHAVTRGLNPGVELKETNIPWLGQVPQHWKVGKIYQYCTTGSGTTPNSNLGDWYTDTESGTPWVTTGELRESLIMTTKVKVTEVAIQKHSALKVYPAGTLLIAMYGATIGRLGTLGVSACTNQACCALKPSESLLNKYLYYYLLGMREQLLFLSSGGGQPNISKEKIDSFPLLLPDKTEQLEIANWLDSQEDKVDKLKQKIQTQITLLRERRTSLISHAVTGKVKIT